MNPSCQFLAGAARVDISPRPGVALSGFLGRDGANTGVHDPVFARALALCDGETRALIISCDLVGLEAAAVAGLRKCIEMSCGVSEANIMIACTHTHAGPASMFLRGCGEIDGGWFADFTSKLMQVASEAVTSLAPATFGIGVTQVEGVSRNRRRDDGPLDTSLMALRIDGADDKPIAVVVNFACHPITTGPVNRLVSADFPGVVCREIEAKTGAVAFFLNGPSADINPQTASSRLDCGDGDFEQVEVNGRKIFGAVSECLAVTSLVAPGSLQVRSRLLQLPLLASPAIEELNLEAAAHLEALAEPVRGGDDLGCKNPTALLDWTMSTLQEYRQGAVRTEVAAEVQVFRLADVEFIAVPGELFTELGQQLRSVSPAAHTFIATCANGNVGYIAPAGEFAFGGYEVDGAYKYYGYPSALAPEAGCSIVRQSGEMLNNIKK